MWYRKMPRAYYVSGLRNEKIFESEQVARRPRTGSAAAQVISITSAGRCLGTTPAFASTAARCTTPAFASTAALATSSVTLPAFGPTSTGPLTAGLATGTAFGVEPGGAGISLAGTACGVESGQPEKSYQESSRTTRRKQTLSLANKQVSKKVNPAPTFGGVFGTELPSGARGPMTSGAGGFGFAGTCSGYLSA